MIDDTIVMNMMLLFMRFTFSVDIVMNLTYPMYTHFWLHEIYCINSLVPPSNSNE